MPGKKEFGGDFQIPYKCTWTIFKDFDVDKKNTVEISKKILENALDPDQNSFLFFGWVGGGGSMNQWLITPIKTLNKRWWGWTVKLGPIKKLQK